MQSAPPTLAAMVSIRPDEGLSLHDSWLEVPPIEPGDGFTTGPVLGEGGSSVVSLATQNALGRPVAVKAMRPDRASPEMEQVLLREAWVTGALEHPNIVPIYDIKRGEQGRIEIVLKRVTGRSWFDLLWQPDLLERVSGPLDSLEWSVRTLIQVANAVHFAHERGFLHRDLKPENVMIGDFGEVYVVDWGLALRLDPAGDDRIPLASHTHRIAGTPAYMAPEMLGEGGALGRHTDVFLLGATLFHVLSGDAPFPGEVGPELFGRIRAGQASLPEGVPSGLAAICRRAMSADPSRRHRSVAALRQDLETWLSRRGVDELVSDAQARLIELRQAVHDGERRALYALHGECRFGFRQALALWPEHAEAREGLAETDRIMAAFEARVAELERRDRDLDPRTGRRMRTALVGGMGLFWTVASGLGGMLTDWFPGSAWRRLIALDLFFVVFVGGLAWLGRERLLTTTFNRQVVGLVLIALALQTPVDIGSLAMGLPELTAHAYHPVIWGTVTAAVALLMERRLVPAALGFLGSYLVAAVWPETLFYALSGGCLVFTLNTVLLWSAPEDLCLEPPDA